jgi:hypothetical protein
VTTGRALDPVTLEAAARVRLLERRTSLEKERKMADRIDATLKSDLMDCLAAAFASEDTQKIIDKQVKEITGRVESDLECAIKDNLAINLAAWTADMAARAVESILEGNEDQLRRYLSCEKRAEDGSYAGWTGRSDGNYWGRKREDREWHPVIHGNLFEQGAVALRKKIVDAHRDVLVNERIIDLEDQIKSLVAQVNKLETDKEALWQRVRDAA